MRLSARCHYSFHSRCFLLGRLCLLRRLARFLFLFLVSRRTTFIVRRLEQNPIQQKTVPLSENPTRKYIDNFQLGRFAAQWTTRFIGRITCVDVHSRIERLNEPDRRAIE